MTDSIDDRGRVRLRVLSLMRSARRTVAILFAAGALGSCRTPPAAVPVATEPVGKQTTPEVKPIVPSCRPSLDVALPAPVDTGRSCVIDVGSRNVKLLVAESTGADPRGLHPVRTCRARLQLGEKTQDIETRQPKDLGEVHRIELYGLVAEYRRICGSDKARVVGAFATEWARKATNVPTIVGELKKSADVDLEVVSQEREGLLGYLAATKGQRGRVVLDFGSRSVQVSVWPEREAAPFIMGLALGIDEVGERFFDPETVPNYAAAEKAFVAELRSALVTRPQWKANMKRGGGRLTRTLVSLGENGDVALAMDGKLWSGGKSPTVVQEAEYLELVAGASAKVQALFGRTMGSYDLLTMRAWRKRLQKDRTLFNALRSPERRKAFGHKMLAFPALVNFIATELGVDRVVLVPDELAMGLLVEKQTATGAMTQR